jgi:translocation and assembly module TamB
MSVLRLIAARLGGVLVFLVALSVGALVHLDVPAVRRMAALRLNDALATALPGRVTVERIGSLGIAHVGGVDARAVDPEGVPVLRVHGAQARVSLATLVRSLVSGGDLRVDLPEVTVEAVDVNLDADSTGTLRLLRTFVAEKQEPSSSQGVALSIERAHVGHATVHGRPPGAPPIDADVDGLDASLAVSPGALAVDLARAHVTARRVVGDLGATADLEAHLARPAPDGRDLAARAEVSGSLGPLAGKVTAAYDGGKIEAVADLLRASPEDLRALWPSCPFSGASSAHVEAQGDLARLQLAAHASVGAGVVAIAGAVAVGADTHAKLHLDARQVDAHALAGKAPASDLAASGDVTLDLHGGDVLESTFAIDFAGGPLGGARLPPAKLTGDAQRAADSAVHAHIDALVHEPGAPAHVVLRVAPKGDSLAVAFDASVEAARLQDVALLGGAVQGHATAGVHGTLDLGAGRLDAQIDATAGDVASGALRADSAAVKAHLAGPLAGLRMDATLDGAGLHAPAVDFATVHVEAQGPPTSPAVKVTLGGQGTDVSGSADLSFAAGTALRNLQLVVHRGGVHARAKAALVQVAGSELRVDDAVVEGFGAPLRASVRVSPVELELHATGRRVSLGHVARFARTADPVEGRLSIDADATVHAVGASGRLVLDIDDGALGSWGDAVAHLDVRLDHRRASGKLEARLGDIGRIEASSSSLEVAGTGRLTPSSWRKAWGALDVQAHLDLAKLAAHLPLDRMRLGTLSGAVDVTARVARDSVADVTPDVDVVAKTSGLSASGPKDAPWRLDGTEAAAHVRVDGRTGFTSADAQLGDGHGTLATLATSSDAVPYEALFLTDQPILDLVRAMPFIAHLDVPARDIADLPALLGTRGMHGELTATADFRGSLASPTFDTHASLRHGRADVSLLALPLDLDATGHYDGARAELSLDAQSRKGRVLDARLAVDARVADLLGGPRGGPIPWVAAASATLTRFPLQSLAYLDDRAVRGHASGTFTLDGLHQDARASVSIAADDLTIGDVPCRTARLQASVGGGAFDASARLEPGEGYAEADVHVGAQWGAQLVPTLDTQHPVDVMFAAKQFRAGTLLPLLSRVFVELDGNVDANARLHLDPVARTARPEGTIDLRDGVFQLMSVGGQFHDATAHVVLTPDGIVKLENASAKGLSGKVEAAATARIAGGAFAGARGIVQVPKQEPLPLVLDGVQVGQFDGQLAIAADPAPGGSGVDVTVDVPVGHVELPIATAHDVETLGDIPGVRVGIQKPGGDFASIQLDGDDDFASRTVDAAGAPLRVTVHLGEDVQVRRGTDLDVRLAGSTTLSARPVVKATGQVRLVRGTIEVEGKAFVIENGLVTFVDDPTNPQVKLRAAWTASDGTVVYADFVGPLKTGKVDLTSDPVLPKTEILSLILFGTSDQSPSTSSPSQTSPALGGAAGAAGGAATAPVNRALGGVNHMLDNFGLAAGISTKIDTSQATPRPEVEVQIARDISLQIAWVFGVPPPGSNPDTTLFSLNWRFLRQWSMQTTVGDAGTSILDLVWQHRY